MRSKLKFHDGTPENDELPEDLGASERDEIGIIRAICVKVFSSSFFKSLVCSTDLRL